ncbi:uncharacterized protein [Henckelia pumila]|uniref:uncharacterized protein n=1 Tax=Henckelia pumila TaxID=405737 RepID=UPI003C6DF337
MHGENPPKFSGADFKRWQQKMLFYLTTLSLPKFLKEDPPFVTENDSDTQRRTAVDAWNHDDFLYKNYILNGLDDTLYNVYSSVKTAKELWDSLEKKYKTENTCIKNFVVGKFLGFKMTDTKMVMSQVEEIQIILHDLLAEGMEVNETFQVTSIIEKLPPSWKDFKNYLKHKRKEVKLEDLIVRLCIEEDNRNTEAKSYKKVMEIEAKANLAESSTSHKGKCPYDGKQKSKAKKFQESCYNCGKPNHLPRDCRLPKKNNKNKKNQGKRTWLKKGKGYQDSDLFKLNVMNVNRPEEKNKFIGSAYLTESCDIWHERLGNAYIKTCEVKRYSQQLTF